MNPEASPTINRNCASDHYLCQDGAAGVWGACAKNATQQHHTVGEASNALSHGPLVCNKMKSKHLFQCLADIDKTGQNHPEEILANRPVAPSRTTSHARAILGALLDGLTKRSARKHHPAAITSPDMRMAERVVALGLVGFLISETALSLRLDPNLRCERPHNQKTRGNWRCIIACLFLLSRVVDISVKPSRHWQHNSRAQYALKVCEWTLEVGKRCVDAILDGFNCCLFAYGQTGTGKSHTLVGPLNDASNWGVLPRVCHALFEQDEIAVTASFLELSPARGVVRFLLSEGARRSLFDVEISGQHVQTALPLSP